MIKLLIIILLFLTQNLFSQVDAKIKLNSTAGTTRFEIQDSASATMMQVDSAGNMIVVGSCTVQSNRLAFPQRGIITTSSMTIQLSSAEQEVVVNRADGAACFVIKDNYNFYPRVYERRIYDDEANKLLAITTHTYVESLGIKTNQIKDSAGTRVITTANDATVNTTVTTIHGDLRVNGNDILDSAGTTRLTLGTPVIVAGANIRVGGNTIEDSAGTARITLGDTSTYSSTVTVRGMTVQGDLNISQGRLSDNSIVSADIADGTIATADIGNRQVTSAKLCISTAQVYGNDWAGTATWNLYESQSVNVTTAPAVIIAMVTCVANTWDNTTSKFRITIGGTQVVANQVKPDDERTGGESAGDLPVALVGMLRVTTTGTYAIQFEGTNQASQVGNRSLVAFWVGAP